jgi:hypothetical protein
LEEYQEKTADTEKDNKPDHSYTNDAWHYKNLESGVNEIGRTENRPLESTQIYHNRGWVDSRVEIVDPREPHRLGYF